VRDLSRCREDAQKDLVRSRHRRSKFLLRRGLVFRAGCNWSQRHRTWLNSLRFDREVDRTIFEDYLLAVEQHQARVGVGGDDPENPRYRYVADRHRSDPRC